MTLKKPAEYFFRRGMKRRTTLSDSSRRIIPREIRHVLPTDCDGSRRRYSSAKKIDNDQVRPAFPVLHLEIAKCHEDLTDFDNAKRNLDLVNSFDAGPSDKGPFYHGTKADLEPDDLLTAGYGSNYKADLTMNHIYFTALMNGAGLAASLAKGEGRERVYIVEPTGSFENDPNVTNKKFPGNPTRSYRTKEPLRIVGEATEWMRQTSDDVQKWRARLQDNKGEIIN